MQKLHNKDFQIAFKTGSDANKSKFAKECASGELYVSDTGGLYIAGANAGASDSPLNNYKLEDLYLLNKYSLSFDGSNDYLSVTQNSAINISGDITLSAWINRTSTTNYNAILTKRQVGGSMNYQFTIDNSNGQVGLGHSGGAWVYNTTTTLSTNTWYHVAVTVSSGTAQFYINGVAEDSFTGVTITATTQDLIIGATVSYNYFGGLIDEVSVFNSALSASQITNIYNGGTPANLSSLNPVGWWRMGDDPKDSATSGGSVATITDSSGNGNDATQSTAASQPTFKALDKSTTSISFDGSDDSFAFTGSAGIQLDQIFSASCWIKVNTIASDPRGVITWGEAVNGKGRGVYISNATVGLFGYTDSYNQMSSSSLTTGAWYHVAVTYDGLTANVYLNGALDKTRNFSLNSFTYSQTHIGELYYSQTTPARHFDGYMDDLALFNTALSASDVASLATSRGAHIINDLSLSPVAYYRMGEDNGLTDGQTGISQITDASGNGKHATQSTASYQPTARVFSVIYV